MKQSNKKKLVSMLMTLAFIMGIAVVGYAEEVVKTVDGVQVRIVDGVDQYDFDDTKGIKEWIGATLPAFKAKVEMGMPIMSWDQAMKGVIPNVGGIAEALVKNDRKTIIKLTERFQGHTLATPPGVYWIPEDRKERFAEVNTYSSEAHYWGTRLKNHAKDPKVEMNVLMSDYTEFMGRCIRCHDRFRDTKK